MISPRSTLYFGWPMIVSESVLLPEPFGPMIACTEPLSTVRSIPLRMGFPSTLTWRSRITRSAGRPSSGVNAHPLSGLPFRELRERHPVEGFRDRALELQPHHPSAAVGLVHAVHDRLALGGTDLRLDRPLQRAHDVSRRDARGIPGQRVATARTALAIHETGPAQRGDELLEIRL